MRLTNKQYNVVQKLLKGTNNTWFSIIQDKYKNDIVVDKITNKRYNLYDGMMRLYDENPNAEQYEFLTVFERFTFLDAVLNLMIRDYEKEKKKWMQDDCLTKN